MFDFLTTLLTPFVYVISWILYIFHEIFSFIGLDPANGWTWVLSIVCLVLVIRAALIPVFVKQIKAQRGMQVIQPEMRKIQQKYKGKTDQLSRQAMVQEQTALYKKHGTNPFSACLPMVIQMPFFFALFNVLSRASHAATQNEGIGALSVTLIHQFDNAKIFGAPLSAALLPSIQGGTLIPPVAILSIIMIIAMIASQFFTQRQIMSKNMSEDALQSPFMKQQRMMMYFLPLVFGIGGINFPIGVLIYWTTTNLWTMGQQFMVIRKMPTPGSPAAKALAERRAAKSGGTVVVGAKESDGGEKVGTSGTAATNAGKKPQRAQPQRTKGNKRKR